MVLNLETDTVGVVIMGYDRAVMQGDLVKKTVDILSTPVWEICWCSWESDWLEGSAKEHRQIESKAPGIVAIKSGHELVQTGIKATEVKEGRGQGGQRSKRVNNPWSPNR